jgi:hypothetical protein
MLDAYRDLIEELTGTPTELRRALDAAPELGTRAAPLIAALRDRDQAVYDRWQTWGRGRDRVLARHPDTEAEGARERDAEAALAGLNPIRGELVSLLMNLTLRDWERTAIDETGAETVLADEVERHVEYDEEARARILGTLGR